jgi:hypothetical protein
MSLVFILPLKGSPKENDKEKSLTFDTIKDRGLFAEKNPSGR